MPWNLLPHPYSQPLAALRPAPVSSPFSRARWPALLAAACMGFLASHALAQSSEYSVLKDCPDAKNLHLPGLEGTANAVRCKAPAGYALYIVEEDPRSYVVLGYGKNKLFSTQPHTQMLGLFPNIGDSPAEWRLDKGGKPYALIVRLLFQDADTPDKGLSRLQVYALQPTPRFVGNFVSNEQARQAADALIKSR